MNLVVLLAAALVALMCCSTRVLAAGSEDEPDTYAGVKLGSGGGVGNSPESKPFFPDVPVVFVVRPEWANPLDLKVSAKKSEDDEGLASFWHDIPSMPETKAATIGGAPASEDAVIVNFVPEILKGGIGKLELMKGVEGNPIMFDTKEVKNAEGEVLYERPRYVAYGPSPFTYGLIPQTWEDSTQPDPVTNIIGDNDPIDALDISPVTPLIGAPYQAKVLGSLGLIDDNETDWKVVVINVNDPNAAKYDSIKDVPEEVKERIFTYFRDKPVAVGEAPGVFWPELSDDYNPKVWFNVDQTKSILEHTGQAYKNLIGDCGKVRDLAFAYGGCSGDAEEAPTPAPCCKALTAKCLSCVEGVSEAQYCESNPATVGCEEESKEKEEEIPSSEVSTPPTPCCMALTADCLSCSQGLTVQEFCERNPEEIGCEDAGSLPVQDEG